MHPQVVFDIGQVGYQASPFVILGLVFFVIALVWFLVNFSKKKRALAIAKSPWGNLAPYMRALAVGFAATWTAVVFISTYPGYHHLRDALAQGRCQATEGRVEHFHTGTGDRGSTEESFDVRGVHFSYFGSSMGSGFSQIQAEGGPMKEGLHVRIFAYQGVIARLEILP
ncbi:MAG TPA: hypothetical protein VFF77_07585 [Holophagaceae bacterium]|nr:hypothetical protein [Holophagaceae bacterium]